MAYGDLADFASDDGHRGPIVTDRVILTTARLALSFPLVTDLPLLGVYALSADFNRMCLTACADCDVRLS